MDTENSPNFLADCLVGEEFTVQEYSKNDPILDNREPRLYFLLEGRAIVTVPGYYNNMVGSHILDAGDYFGAENAFLCEPFSAKINANCLEPTRV